MDRKNINVPYPPAELFKYKVDRITQVTQERRKVYYLDYIYYPADGGIYIYHRGVKYPQKGFPTPDSVGANNLVKRFLRNQILFFSRKEFLISFFPFLLLPWKFKMKLVAQWVAGFKQFSFLALQPHLYEDKRYSVPCRALRTFITVFTESLGIANGRWLGLYMSHLIEFDNAYRLMMEDILTATTAEALMANPRKEVLRLSKVFSERETSLKIKTSFIAVCRLLSIMLLLPRIRRAFKKALLSIDFKDLQMDAADHYHTLLAGGLSTGGYEWHGTSQEQRAKEYEAIHKGIYPPFAIVEDVQFQ